MGCTPPPELLSRTRRRTASPAVQHATVHVEVACFAGCAAHSRRTRCGENLRQVMSRCQLTCSTEGTLMHNKSEGACSCAKRLSWAALLAAPVHPVHLPGNHGIGSPGNHSLPRARKGRVWASAARDGRRERPGWRAGRGAPRRRRRSRPEPRVRFEVSFTSVAVLNRLD